MIWPIQSETCICGYWSSYLCQKCHIYIVICTCPKQYASFHRCVNMNCLRIYSTSRIQFWIFVWRITTVWPLLCYLEYIECVHCRVGTGKTPMETKTPISHNSHVYVISHLVCVLHVRRSRQHWATALETTTTSSISVQRAFRGNWRDSSNICMLISAIRWDSILWYQHIFYIEILPSTCRFQYSHNHLYLFHFISSMWSFSVLHQWG